MNITIEFLHKVEPHKAYVSRIFIISFMGLDNLMTGF
jgi:hypothetical protein